MYSSYPDPGHTHTTYGTNDCSNAPAGVPTRLIKKKSNPLSSKTFESMKKPTKCPKRFNRIGDLSLDILEQIDNSLSQGQRGGKKSKKRIKKKTKKNYKIKKTKKKL
jgi:hypothetical protein